MKECTFFPNTSKSKRTASINKEGSVNSFVRGMETVYKTRDLANQKKLAEAEREKELFDFVGKYNARKLEHETHTVPVPFKLSKVLFR